LKFGARQEGTFTLQLWNCRIFFGGIISGLFLGHYFLRACFKVSPISAHKKGHDSLCHVLMLFGDAPELRLEFLTPARSRQATPEKTFRYLATMMQLILPVAGSHSWRLSAAKL
jgi:hypothetical protein